MTKRIGMGVTLAVLLAAGGCTSGGDGGGGPASVYEGGSGEPGTPGGSTSDPTGGSTTGDPSLGNTGTAGTGSATDPNGTVTDPNGTVTDPNGTAGTGSTTDPVIDDSNFLTCVGKTGNVDWGTEVMAGPCGGTLTTRYGVPLELGPYGASSVYNVGADFPVALNAFGDATCPAFVATFGADPKASADLLDTKDLDFTQHTVFYPGVMPEGEKFPLLTWGNGTCAMPEGYGPLLRYIASYGYIIVAPNNRWVGSGEAQKTGLDFMFAENDDPNSMWYQRIDTDNVGAMGHSQGSGGTAMAATDARIKAVILYNGGTTASKPFLAISGDKDIGAPTASQFANSIAVAPKGAFLFYHMIPTMMTDVDGDTTSTGGSAGHLTLMQQPDRLAPASVAWWDMMLKGDQTARDMFVGDTCGLCNMDADFEFGQNGL